MTGKSTGERFRDKVYLALIVAALSFVGAAAGTFVTSRLDESRWIRDTTFSVKREMFAKRMELLERTVKVFSQLQTLDFYHNAGKYAWVEGETMIRAGKSAQASVDATTAAAVKVKEAQAELSAVMTLDEIYFGPKTQDAIRQLEKALEAAETWWKVDGARRQAVLDAAAAELQYGFERRQIGP